VAGEDDFILSAGHLAPRAVNHAKAKDQTGRLRIMIYRRLTFFLFASVRHKLALSFQKGPPFTARHESLGGAPARARPRSAAVGLRDKGPRESNAMTFHLQAHHESGLRGHIAFNVGR